MYICVLSYFLRMPSIAALMQQDRSYIARVTSTRRAQWAQQKAYITGFFDREQSATLQCATAHPQLHHD